MLIRSARDPSIAAEVMVTELLKGHFIFGFMSITIQQGSRIRRIII